VISVDLTGTHIAQNADVFSNDPFTDLLTKCPKLERVSIAETNLQSDITMASNTFPSMTPMNLNTYGT
jgi:hypothetical protein